MFGKSDLESSNLWKTGAPARWQGPQAFLPAHGILLEGVGRMGDEYAVSEIQKMGGSAPAPASAERHSSDSSHIKLSYITHFYFNQGDTSTLTDLLRRYAEYPADILDHLQFVLVDDGSPAKVEIPEDLNLNVLLLRINEDIPWNQPGARNLGVTCARSDKIVLTDLDHEFPAETLREMIRRKNPGRTMYKVRRYDTSGRRRSTHSNTFFMSRGRFMKLYGYDEEFSGHYGCDDTTFWRWQRNHGTRSLYLPRFCRVVDRDVDREKAYHTLQRDLSHNRPIAARKKAAWRQYGADAGHSRQFLRFTWSVVLDRHRQTALPVPPRNRWWAWTWWLRGLLPSA
jgi:hypothetical protein